jgi:hypothetical protein
MNWESVALLAEAEVDLRDPKLSVFPDGRLMVIMGGSFYQGTTLLKREMRVSISDPETGEFSRLMRAHIDPKIATSTDWLWRVLWHDDTAYGVVYQPNAERQGLHLVKSRVGIDWKHVTELEIDGVGNETTLRMLPDGRMAALVRQDGSPAPAMFGTAKPPFTDWSWTSTGTRIGGPNFVVLPDGRLLASGREYTSSGARTMVGWIGKDGQFTKSLTLPSGGDTSYPGMVVRGDQLWLSYYSSHEGKTAIYLAVLRIDRL